jgi:hypothetical protein
VKVINLFAGPGTGKSVTSSVLYGMLSLAGYKVQYVPEFAKFAVYSKNVAALSDQIYMFGKQENRLHVLKDGDLDFVIMDGPLPLALLFAPDNYYEYYEPLVMEVFKGYDNINYFLDRNPAIPYQQNGREQSLEQAEAMCERTREILRRHAVPFDSVQVHPGVAAELFERIVGRPAPKL